MASSVVVAHTTGVCSQRTSIPRRGALNVVSRSGVQEERRREAAAKTLPLLVTSFVAATTLWVAPVDAGVILTQPQLKRLDISPTKTQPAKKSSRSSGPSAPSLGVDLGFASLPLTVIGCVALYFAASRYDTGFESFMTNLWIKDSVSNGIGYEEIYKSTNYTSGSRGQKK